MAKLHEQQNASTANARAVRAMARLIAAMRNHGRPGSSPARHPVAGTSVSGYGLAVIVVLCMLVFPTILFADVTTIRNTGTVTFKIDQNSAPMQQPTNTTETAVYTSERTRAEILFYEYAPGEDAQAMDVQITKYAKGGESGPLTTLPPPENLGQPIDLANPVPLVPTDAYRAGQPIFVKVRDYDQNMNPEIPEKILLTLTFDATGDIEILELTETGPDTGEFLGYIQSRISAPVKYSGQLTVKNGQQISALYVDRFDDTDASVDTALIDPFGLVFDSKSGEPVDGATVTLVNTDTGQPATVFGDDGSTIFPSSVVSGSTVQTGEATYAFPSGFYQFPLVAPGTYHLVVDPPPGYTAPSEAPVTDLQDLPGAPFAIGPAAYGETFEVKAGPGFRVDIPLDPQPANLLVRKTAARGTVGIGEFLRYNIEVENANESTIPATVLTDVLPRGFRYESGTAYLNNTEIDNPEISENGRTLRFALGDIPPKTVIKLRYIVAVTAGAKPGKAANSAAARGAGDETSNTARAVVFVQDDLRGDCTIVGRVMIDDPPQKNPENPRPGVEDVRIYLEDGSFVLTDKDGQYHFEGVKPGIHVVQLDIDSLPPHHKTVGIANTRFAGRTYSQFVDLKAGALWRADFPVRRVAQPAPEISARASLERRGNAFSLDTTIATTGETVDKAVLTVVLPPGLTANPKTVTVNGQAIQPHMTDRAVTVNTHDLRAGTDTKVRMTLTPNATLPAEAVVKAMILYPVGRKANARLPILSIPVQESAAEPAIATAKGELPKSTEPSKEDAPISKYETDAWLNNATPEFQWLQPANGALPAIPSLNIAIKHDPAHNITLLLNGTPVKPIHFEGTKRNRKKTAAISKWRGVDIDEQTNTLTAVVQDRDGTLVHRKERIIPYPGPPVAAKLLPDQSTLVADGKTVPVIAVRLLDADGLPARQSLIGEYSVTPPYEALDKNKAFDRRPAVGPTAGRPKFVIGPDGVARIKLDPTPKSGKVSLRIPMADDTTEEIEAWLKPAMRDWILVGLAQGRAGYNVIHEKMSAGNDDNAEAHAHWDGRTALFAKGKIKGKWLLTLAYDSNKDTDRLGRRSLHQIIDPDANYTLYGDETRQGYEAASSEKLYVKLERDTFYAMFGDFDTDLRNTQLGRYSRNLTGGKTEYRGKKFSFNAFVSQTDQGFLREEIRGNGTSGIYHLDGGDIVINSETITLETRDRFHSEIILEQQTLARHVDYEIDYENGTLFFKQPVMSKDRELNPIFIVAEYDLDSGTEKAMVYGGRGAAKLTPDVEVGATFIHEGTQGAEGDLHAGDLTFDLDENTQFRAEISDSERKEDGDSLRGNAYLAELGHQSRRVDSRLYFRETEEDFGLGHQSPAEVGTRKYGFEMDALVTQQLTLGSEVSRRENLEDDNRQDVFEADATWEIVPFELTLGFLHARDRFDNGDEARSNQIKAGGAWTGLDDRLRLRLDHYQSIGSDNDSADYPTRTIAGTDYRLTNSVLLYGEYEIVHGEAARGQALRAGIETTPWTGGRIRSSVGQELLDDGNRTFANLGLYQTHQIDERWSISGSVDTSRTVAGARTVDEDVPLASGNGDGDDFTALTMGLGYTTEKWGWAGRVEQRYSDSDENFSFTTGIVGEVQPRLSMSLSAAFFNTDAEDGSDSVDADIRWGIAYRPLDADWIVLNRLDLIYERGENEDTNTESQRIVNWLNLNYMPRDALQVSLKHACKYVLETIEEDRVNAFTDFIGVEARYDITKRWDIGLQAAAMHSWAGHQISYSGGPSVGVSLAENTWVSLGYNVVGFYDEDFAESEYTAQGPYIQFRLKFDQDSVGDLKKLLTRQ